LGDGPEKERLEQAIKLLPENIKFSILGQLDNSEVIAYYKRVFVDGFISLSESEGLPVSMMEAISFGIPILARNVGGVSEIVNEITGILINQYDDPGQKMSEFLSKKWDRQAIIAYQHEYFDAMKNYSNFTEELCGIS
jgi:glycosyltransferase involved in cell wall biosynthesis